MAEHAAQFPDFSFSAPAPIPSHIPHKQTHGHATMGSAIDRDTFDQLVSGHLPQALAFAVRLVGDVHAAEDVVQEALYRAARSWQSFRGQSSFKTWLFQIVVNVFRDHLSARPDSVDGREEVRKDLPDVRTAEPLEQASAGELGALVARLVSALPPRQREMLVLVAYEGLTPAQAAGVLAISESNARANLAHARQRLKEQLAPYMGTADRR